MTPFILTLVIVFYGNGNPTTTASVYQEYTSMAACEAAKKVNRENLQQGTIVLSSCTQK